MNEEKRKEKNSEEKEVKDLKYFVAKLNNFLDLYRNTYYRQDVENKDDNILFELEQLLIAIKKHIDDDKKDELYHYKHYFLSLIRELENEKQFNKTQIKPIKTDMQPYNEKAYNKLNYLFRKQGIHTEEEIEELYERDIDNLKNKYNLFIDLIDWLNSKGFSIIPEKTLFSAFLGINVETYNDLLKKSPDMNVRNLFRNIDEYFTTSQFGGLIADSRKSLERIQKTEKYGQEMKQTQPENLNIIQNNSMSYSDLMNMITSKSKNIIDITANNSNLIETKKSE